MYFYFRKNRYTQLLYKDMKVGTYFIVKNAELSTDTFHLVPTFLSIYRDKKMGTFLNKDTKVETL